MKMIKALLIRLLGGERKIYVPHRVVEYNGLGRPFEMSDWERLATMQSWGQEFFRYIAFQLQALDNEDRRIPIGTDRDRERLVNAIRRMCLLDMQKLADTAAAKVTGERNRTEHRAKEKGLNNHGK